MMSALPVDPASETPPPQVILLVDDEVLVRMVVSDYLRECGYHVLEAADGNEAIRILTCADRPIDLVFSDVQMPNLDGFGLARWIRENRPGMPIVLTSGSHAEAVARATELCHEGPVIAKPFDHARLLRQLRTMLARAGEK